MSQVYLRSTFQASAYKVLYRKEKNKREETHRDRIMWFGHNNQKMLLMYCYGFSFPPPKSQSNGSQSMITVSFQSWPCNRQKSLKGRRRWRTGALRQNEIEKEFT